MSTPMPICNNPLSDLLPAASDGADSWRWATVTSTNPLRIRLDGDSQPLLATPDTLTPVIVGERVRVQIYHHRATIIGTTTGSAMLLAAHPVGSYYWSSDPTSPEVLFGGTWEQITDRFIYAAGTIPAGTTGGEATHTLTLSEMPTHRHLLGSGSSSAHGFSWGSSGTVNIANAVAVAGRSSGNRLFTFQSDPDWRGGQAMGGNQPHNNMPPYLTAYCWHRTA